ncbi:hypothetical protein CIB48_g7306 [Xylaria polymorpha]|nr:hypothetical protein CIB48_g7306 [Xylaria polymorpha]
MFRLDIRVQPFQAVLKATPTSRGSIYHTPQDPIVYDQHPATSSQTAQSAKQPPSPASADRDGARALSPICFREGPYTVLVHYIRGKCAACRSVTALVSRTRSPHYLVC